MQRILLALFVFVVVLAGHLSADEGTWTPIGPGAGAMITTVHCDNASNNQIWVGTQTHGLYYSPNGGKLWVHRGDGLGSPTVTAIENEPKEQLHENKKYHPKRKDAEEDETPRTGLRVYAGTAQGLYASNDRGNTWSLCEGTEGSPIGGILINPYNSDQVWAFEGWSTLDDEIGAWLAEGVETTEARRIWLSTDRGESFQAVKYESKAGYRRAYSMVMHPDDPRVLYLGAHSGVYQSKNSGKSWKRLKDPKGAKSGVKAKTRELGSRGVDISPSGQYLVAIYCNKDGKFAPHFAETKKHKWSEAAEELPLTQGGRRRRTRNNEFAMPRFVQAGSELRVVVGILSGSRLGLYGARLDADGSKLSAMWSPYCQEPGEEFEFPMGWTKNDFHVRAIDVAPASWKECTVVISTTFTALAGFPNASGFPKSRKSWKDLCTDVPDRGDGSTTKGVQGGRMQDVVRHQKYIASADIRQGVIESFDGGKTWSRSSAPFDFATVPSVAIVGKSTPVVLANFRERITNNLIYAKKLVNRDENDEWIKIGGGSRSVGGLHSRPITSIRTHRSDLEIVLLGTEEDGVWFTPKISELIVEKSDAQGWINATDGTAIAKAHIYELEQDSLERDVFWALAGGSKSGLWRGEYDRKKKKWSWKQTKSIKNPQTFGGLSISKQGKTRLIAMGYASSAKESSSVFLSSDDGKNFEIALSASDVARRHQVANLRKMAAGKHWRVSAIKAIGKEFLISFKDEARHIGLGVARLKVEVPAEGKELGKEIALWNGISGLQQGIVARFAAYFEKDKPSIYLALPGAGLAVRALDDFVATPVFEDPSENTKGDEK